MVVVMEWNKVWWDSIELVGGGGGSDGLRGGVYGSGGNDGGVGGSGSEFRLIKDSLAHFWIQFITVNTPSYYIVFLPRTSRLL